MRNMGWRGWLRSAMNSGQFSALNPPEISNTNGME